MFGSRAFDEPNPPIFAFVPSAIDFRISLNFDNHLWPFLVNNHVLTILLQYSIQNNKLSKRRRKNSLWWSWWRTPAKLYCYRYRHTNTHFLLHIACTLTHMHTHTEHGGSRGCWRRPGTRDGRRMCQIWSCDQVSHFWGEYVCLCVKCWDNLIAECIVQCACVVGHSCSTCRFVKVTYLKKKLSEYL